MSDQETPQGTIQDNPTPQKKNLIPFFVFLLVIVVAGGGIAFGILWFTNQPTQGEDTAAFLPPDTKVAVHIAGLAELYEETKKWGLADLLGMAGGGQIDLSGFEQIVKYCKTQVRGDCRMLFAIREFEPEDPNATTNLEPIIMLEGREHQAMLKLLAASGEFGDLKLEDEGPEVKRVAIGGGENLYITTRGPFIAASRDLKHIKFLNLSKDKPYKPTASKAWLERWSSSQMAVMLDVPAWRQRFAGEWDEAKKEMQAATAQDGTDIGASAGKMMQAMFQVADNLKGSTQGAFGFFTLSGDGIKLSVVADIKEDSDVGKSIPALAKEKADFKLLGAIPKGYAFYAGSTPGMAKFKPLADLQKSIQQSILGADAPDLFGSMLEVGTGTSFVFGQGLSQVAVYRTTNPREMLAKILETYQATQKSGIYQSANVSTTIEENAGELKGIKFHRIVTDLGLDQMDPGGEGGAMMGMIFGSGVMSQWIGADDKYIYQMTGPQLEDLEPTMDHLANNKAGVGEDAAFKESLSHIGSPQLAGGLMDFETLLAPIAMFVAPGLIKPGESPNYVVMGMSAPEKAVALDFWLPKKLVDKAQQAVQQMQSSMGGLGGGGLGGGLGGGMGGGMGGGLDDDMGDSDPFGGSFEDEEP